MTPGAAKKSLGRGEVSVTDGPPGSGLGVGLGLGCGLPEAGGDEGAGLATSPSHGWPLNTSRSARGPRPGSCRRTAPSPRRRSAAWTPPVGGAWCSGYISPLPSVYPSGSRSRPMVIIWSLAARNRSHQSVTGAPRLVTVSSAQKPLTTPG